MRATTTLRHQASRVLNQAESSSAAGPSFTAAALPTATAVKPPPSYTKADRAAPFLPNGKAPASTLRTLVSLHHESASFMRDPSEIPTAFMNAHTRYTTEFISYAPFAAYPLRMADAGKDAPDFRPGRMGERHAGAPGMRGAVGDERAPADRGRAARSVFTARTNSHGRRPPALDAASLTKRELLVKEAILGTWERSNDNASRPGLEGVVDIVSAKGDTIDSAAAQWHKRDEIDPDTTEDGM